MLVPQVRSKGNGDCGRAQPQSLCTEGVNEHLACEDLNHCVDGGPVDCTASVHDPERDANGGSALRGLDCQHGLIA